MWSTENLTKVRKKSEVKKIRVDSSLFYPGTFAECEAAAKPARPLQSTSSPYVGAYYIRDKATKPRAYLPFDSQMHESKTILMKKPSRPKEPSDDLSKLGHTESASSLL